jgi:hypothetical protein
VLFEPAQLFVGRAKIVAPFADAVGFINGNTSELTLLVDGLEKFAEVGRGTEFRGYVEKARVRVAALEVGFDAFAVLCWRVGIYRFCSDASC